MVAEGTQTSPSGGVHRLSFPECTPWVHPAGLAGWVGSSQGHMGAAVLWQFGCLSLEWVWGEQAMAYFGGLAHGL